MEIVAGEYKVLYVSLKVPKMTAEFAGTMSGTKETYQQNRIVYSEAMD